jgi:hypothetical protein
MNVLNEARSLHAQNWTRNLPNTKQERWLVDRDSRPRFVTLCCDIDSGQVSHMLVCEPFHDPSCQYDSLVSNQEHGIIGTCNKHG